MHSLTVGGYSHADDFFQVLGRFPVIGPSDIDTFISRLPILTLPIRIGINRHGGDTQPFAGTNNARGDFTSACDQNFIKHGVTHNGSGPEKTDPEGYQITFCLSPGFSQYTCKHVIIPQHGVSNILTEFDEINGILAGNLLCIEGTESKEGFT